MLPEYIKNSQKSTIRQQSNFKVGNRFSSHITKENIRMSNKNMKSYSKWLISRKVQITANTKLPSRVSLVAQLVKRIHLQCRITRFNSWGGKICWRRDRLPTPVFMGIPGGSAGKESSCNAGDLGSIPALGRAPGEGNSYPLQYSNILTWRTPRTM